MKTCTKCKESKETTEYYKTPTTKDRLSPHCKECHLKLAKKRNLANPNYLEEQRKATAKWREKNKHKLRGFTLKQKYGISEEDYNIKLEKQEYCCKLCKTKVKELTKPLYVDHCHISNNVRDLLCQRCNTGLGMFRDNPQLLRDAADYVERHND